MIGIRQAVSYFGSCADHEPVWTKYLDQQDDLQAGPKSRQQPNNSDTLFLLVTTFRVCYPCSRLTATLFQHVETSCDNSSLSVRYS
jgi:hypothetical protein